jgi:hypothetical protein
MARMRRKEERKEGGRGRIAAFEQEVGAFHKFAERRKVVN